MAPEEDSDVLDQLKQAVIEVRGPTHTAWGMILNLKQAREEPFETFAFHSGTVFRYATLFQTLFKY